jgi:hypothetical protein
MADMSNYFQKGKEDQTPSKAKSTFGSKKSKPVVKSYQSERTGN